MFGAKIPAKEFKYLTPDQIDHFMEYGYIKIKGAFTPEKAAQFTSDVWVRLGMDPNDKSTWTANRTNMPSHRSELVQTFAPKAWGAICELLGGEERVDPVNATWNDGLIVNLGTPEMETEETPHPRDLDGWHVDGDFFRHFLDSPEQALLVIPLFSDIKPRGGGTFIAPDGIEHVAEFLAANPQGVLPGSEGKRTGNEFDFKDLIGRCQQFHEMTGELGDHSASHNNLRVPRLITNPPVSLPSDSRFNLSRENPADYSLVELKTLKALGADPLKGGYKFEATHPRERVIPDRLKVQSAMLEEEKKRLAQMKHNGLQGQGQAAIAA